MSRQVTRYDRQELLPEIGLAGQAALAGAHAMVIGCGALGCPTLDLLARAGVGEISIVDRDIVELTNLQRQTLFTEVDAAGGLPKAVAAATRLRAVNSSIRVNALVEDFSVEDAEQIVRPHPTPGVLIDCTDNFQTRYLINDVAVKLGIPLVYGGAVGNSGMVMTIRPGITPCLRCLFPDTPDAAAAPSCDTAGIFAPVSATIGAMQAAEAIKLLAGRADLLSRTLTTIDLMAGRIRQIEITNAKNADCPCCVRRVFVHLDQQDAADRVLCGRGAVQVSGNGPVDLDVLQAKLTRVGNFERTEHLLRGSIYAATDNLELTVFADGRAIVKGTTDPAAARSLYRRYVGA